ncbi:Phosphate regulon sensor protein PhoR (SphS) [Candidatus Rhodobacter oscarellae]|uniref:histidine kinase n=2 Tax=Candidatus Rhodobacter oscarellae TaxID=1675527 RepID=A0A0J9GUJ1_9RHOB|nr:Phosphate regulon sensor protein PhoR (SphS) [Candidatus Rhodobacter lobularis]
MALVLIGRDERVIAANKVSQGLFGNNLEGRHYITVLRQPAVLDCVERALKAGETTEKQFPSRDATRDTTYQVIATPVRTEIVRGALLSLEDITHVQEATQMRRDFVANVSHELRTPLTALLGFIETLRGPARDDPAAQERFLEIMAREAERMNRLIHDLLSLSRVEAEERMRPTDMVDLASLLTSASTTLGQTAADHGVELSLTGVEESLQVPGDADQLLQVFTNLIENAIKYGGGRAEVNVSVSERDPALRGPAVRVEVKDDGDGIDPLQLPRLTERFYRVDSHRSREIGGTGLGLAIVKHIVNRHRGRLRIESTQGQGSRFVVILPAPE